MRCWHPRAEEVVSHVRNFNPDEIILMPLYPQYSAATSGSSIKEWKDICKKNNLKIKTSTICCYPIDDNFILAHKEEIIKKITNLKNLGKFNIAGSLNRLNKNGSTFSNLSGPPKLKRITAFFINNLLLYSPNIQTY